ncbi:MAG: LEA type 2 family protein [Pseudomonadota bacterium]
MKLPVRHWLIVCLGACMVGCASTGGLLGQPEVSLTDVEVTAIDLKGQSFVLSFDVSNPNPFPLAISQINYGVELDGHRFASGETDCSIKVPADSHESFEISVDLNLLQTAPKLLFVVRDGVRKEIPYELQGKFIVDIPTSPRVQFENAGNIQLQAANF